MNISFLKKLGVVKFITVFLKTPLDRWFSQHSLKVFSASLEICWEELWGNRHLWLNSPICEPWCERICERIFTYKTGSQQRTYIGIHVSEKIYQHHGSQAGQFNLPKISKNPLESRWNPMVRSGQISARLDAEDRSGGCYGPWEADAFDVGHWDEKTHQNPWERGGIFPKNTKNTAEFHGIYHDIPSLMWDLRLKRGIEPATCKCNGDNDGIMINKSSSVCSWGYPNLTSDKMCGFSMWNMA